MNFFADMGHTIYWIFVICASLLTVAGGFVVLVAVVDGFGAGVKAARKPPNNGG